MEQVSFKEGVFDHRIVGENNKPTGTIVEWLPSEEFFDDVHVNINTIRKLFKVIACLCPGLTIKLDIENKESETFVAKNGLNDLVDESTKGKEIIKNRFINNYINDKYKLDIVMTYTTEYSSTIVPYVNTGLTESGPHIQQIKTTITREMNKFFREKGWLKEKDNNLSGEDCQEGMYLIFNITAPDVAYDSQIKTHVTKLDMKPFTQEIAESLAYWLRANEKEIKMIADKALNARKAREAARKARDAARSLKSKKENGLKAKMQLSDKFIDCTNRDPKDRVLLLVEGQL